MWWQLFWLRAYVEASGRDVLYEIAPTGRVYIRAEADDARDARAWMLRQAKTRSDYIDTLYNEDGALGVHPFVIGMGRAMARSGCFIRFVWVRIVAAPLPVIEDSS